MTAQATEIFCMDGGCHGMLCTPLENFFDQVGWRPQSWVASTANYRRYIARWEVLGSRLYLSGIVCEIWDIPRHLIGKLAPDPDSFDAAPEGTKTLRLTDLFPDDGPLVPAVWVTGVLTVATGGMLAYVHAGFGSLFASYRLIDVVQGRVRRVRDLSARDWARRVGRHVPDDWFDEEPEETDPEAPIGWRFDRRSAKAEYWSCRPFPEPPGLIDEDQDPYERQRRHSAIQIRNLERPSRAVPDPAALWPRWRDQRRRARLWLTEGRR